MSSYVLSAIVWHIFFLYVEKWVLLVELRLFQMDWWIEKDKLAGTWFAKRPRDLHSLDFQRLTMGLRQWKRQNVSCVPFLPFFELPLGEIQSFSLLTIEPQILEQNLKPNNIFIVTLSNKRKVSFPFSSAYESGG